jgi:hypothetical protein
VTSEPDAVIGGLLEQLRAATGWARTPTEPTVQGAIDATTPVDLHIDAEAFKYAARQACTTLVWELGVVKRSGPDVVVEVGPTGMGGMVGPVRVSE